MRYSLPESIGTVGYGLAGACFALLAAGAFFGGHLPAITAIGLLGVAAFSFAAPFHALLFFIAVSPIAGRVAPLFAPQMDGQLFAELLAAVCLAGTLLRCAGVRAARRPLATVDVVAVLLTMLAATSAIAALGPDYVRLSNGAPAAPWAWHLLSQDYFAGSGVLRSLYGGLPVIEALLLFVVLRMNIAGRGQEAAIRMLVLGAAAAAIFDVEKLLLVFARTGSFGQMVHAALHVRISVAEPDVNAAGSYFAMALMPAAAMIPSRRVAGIALAMLILAGEVLSGSRTAWAATALTAAALAVYGAATTRHPVRRKLLIGALVVMAIGAVPGWRYVAARRADTSVDSALQYRRGMWQKGVEMTAAHPVFGVGVGEFAVTSTQYEPRSASWLAPENAHDQFLQISAELGLPGFAAFLAIVCASVIHRYPTALPYATGVGIIAFLLSALAGHPLLIPTVAYSFWLALAMASVRPTRGSAPNWLRLVAIVVVVALVVSVPWRVRAAIDAADLEHIGVGVSGWITDQSGDKYRIASSCARFYVPADARRIEVTMRAHAAVELPLEVEFEGDGHPLNRLRLGGSEWETMVFTGPMPGARTRRFSPIDLRVYESGKVLPCGAQEVVDVRKIVAMQ